MFPLEKKEEAHNGLIVLKHKYLKIWNWQTTTSCLFLQYRHISWRDIHAADGENSHELQVSTLATYIQYIFNRFEPTVQKVHQDGSASHPERESNAGYTG